MASRRRTGCLSSAIKSRPLNFYAHTAEDENGNRLPVALKRNQWFYQPCLGWKEFAPDYFGPFRPETRVCASENHGLRTMLRIGFDQMQNGMNWN